MLKLLTSTTFIAGVALSSAVHADGHGGPYAAYEGTTLIVNFPSHPHYNAVLEVLPRAKHRRCGRREGIPSRSNGVALWFAVRL